MQYFLTFIILLLSLTCASAINEIRFILNNGFDHTQTSGCNSQEMDKINAAFQGRRLGLGSGAVGSSVKNETSSLGARKLGSTSAICKNLCAGLASCIFKGCKRYRALSVDDEQKGSRNLMTCIDEINAVHARLDNVRNQVTTSCKNFLEKWKRRADCYSEFEYGQIEGVRVWKIGTGSTPSQTIHTSMVLPGGSVTICKSMYVNFESLNEPCVKFAKLRMTGPNNYVRDHDENVSPFSLFEDDGAVLQGKYMPSIGTFKLQITPDSDSAKTKTFTVVVQSC